jgi:hypothetical protein
MWLNERLAEGDVLVKEHIETEARTAAEAETAAAERAKRQRQRFDRLKDALRPGKPEREREVTRAEEREGTRDEEHEPTPEGLAGGREPTREERSLEK